MKTPRKVALDKLGSDSQPTSGHSVDKSAPINDLAKQVGNSERYLAAEKEAMRLPATTSNPSQLLATARLAIRQGGAAQYTPVSQLRAAPRAHEEGSTQLGPLMQNEFRIAFDQLAPIGQEHGARRAAVLPRVDLLTRALFLEGLSLDLTSIATMILPSGGKDPIDINFYKAYRKLVDSGRIQVAATGLAGPGKTPFAFDLRSDEPFARHPTFASVLRAYQDSDASSDAKRSAIAATRILTGLPRYSSTDNVLAMAGRIKCDVFHGLPDRFAALVPRDAELSHKSIQNCVSALRSVMQFGVRLDLFPLIFPRHRAADEWIDLLDRTFPLGLSGQPGKDIHSTRTGLNVLFAVARTELAVDKPQQLTRELVLECRHRIRAPHRKSEASRVASLHHLLFVGPGDWNDPVVRLIASTLQPTRRVTALPYLAPPVGMRITVTTLEGFCDLLAAHDFDARWKDFFLWYREYSLLDFRQLRSRRAEFPTRPEARNVSEGVFLERLTAARAYLGIAKEIFPDTYGQLGPEDVFGTHFDRLTTLMMEAWEVSANSAVGVSHRSSAGLRSLIIAGGLIAQALLERALHCGRAAPREPLRNEDNALAAPLERLAENRTLVEKALNDAYIDSGRICNGLQAECRKDANGSGKNTVKDLQRSIEETPFEHFCAAQEELLRRANRALEIGGGGDELGRAAVVAALVHGFLVSSGCRRSEIAHLREGVQTNFEAGSRLVKLRVCDRKNDKNHKYIAREKWVPTWLLTAYFETTRPAIAALRTTAEPAQRFLILNPNTGGSYGCEEELADGSGRNDSAFDSRKGALADLWQKHVAEAFVALNLLVPIGAQRFTMHVVRNVAGHWVFQHHGLKAAANFLGDSPRSILGTYAELDGTAVDTSE